MTAPQPRRAAPTERKASPIVRADAQTSRVNDAAMRWMTRMAGDYPLRSPVDFKSAWGRVRSEIPALQDRDVHQVAAAIAKARLPAAAEFEAAASFIATR